VQGELPTECYLGEGDKKRETVPYTLDGSSRKRRKEEGRIVSILGVDGKKKFVTLFRLMAKVSGLPKERRIGTSSSFTPRGKRGRNGRS